MSDSWGSQESTDQGSSCGVGAKSPVKHPKNWTCPVKQSLESRWHPRMWQIPTQLDRKSMDDHGSSTGWWIKHCTNEFHVQLVPCYFMSTMVSANPGRLPLVAKNQSEKAISNIYSIWWRNILAMDRYLQSPAESIVQSSNAGTPIVKRLQ